MKIRSRDGFGNKESGFDVIWWRLQEDNEHKLLFYKDVCVLHNKLLAKGLVK